MTPKDLPELTDEQIAELSIEFIAMVPPDFDYVGFGRKCYELGARSTAAQPLPEAIEWEMLDGTNRTTDKAMAQNWAANVGVRVVRRAAPPAASQPGDPSLVKEFRATGLTGAEAVAAARELAGLQEAAERAAAQPAALPEPVLQALRFYANGDHYITDDAEDFDTVSGEPENWLCSGLEDSSTMIETGRIARFALTGEALNWIDGGEDQQPKPVAGEAFGPAAAQPVEPTMDERGWLIEHSGETPGTSARHVSWLRVRPKFGGYGAKEFGFTHDASDALRFARREDAEAVLAMHMGAHPPDWHRRPYSVSEHPWPHHPAASGDSTPPSASQVDAVELEIASGYVVEKRSGGGFWPYCVRAGDGARELFVGHKKACDNVRAALESACLDGAFMARSARGRSHHG